ncbi:MAG: hypothetical protein DCC73_11850 [Proteobacteria bacterium]|nr:MAG: hypothetical protein DCC73_11850 [Pseudomonadota bacterium]
MTTELPPSNDAASLPPVLAEIADIIGITAALKLAAECGGTYIYISAKPKPDNRAAQVIGADAMRALARHFRAGILEMPIATHAQLHRRNETIRAGAQQGLSQSQLARRHRMTARHVRRICADSAVDDRQIDLFDND